MKKSGGQLQAALAILVVITSTSLCFIPVLFMGLVKLYPNPRWQIHCTRIIDHIVLIWCGINNMYINQTQKNLQWDISGLDNLNTDNWYLVVANHQSWLDIVVLIHVFTRKIPVMKFFIKDQLKWVPLLGFAWWAMGCPFMKRYSREYLQQNPHKTGTDMEATRKAIELFKHTPATIINFVEGTRFTAEKRKLQQSPCQHLLKPRAGGISFVINAMGEKIKTLLDVTIVYPDKQPTLWNFLCHRVHKITVKVREIPIPEEFTDSADITKEETQKHFRNWLNEQWHHKDQLIDQIVDKS